MANEEWLARPSLPAIITAARAGALDHAWAMFAAGGYAARANDAAALAVRGRLLKDRALLGAGEARVTGFAGAAAAYAAADELAPQPYTRVNVATLTLLAGDPAAAHHIAAGLLDWLARDDGIAETPYYLSATRAEALLVTGDAAAAEAAMAEAIAHDPDGWSDHASTLRQLGLILETTAGDATWLDRFRPPGSLHFAGHLGIASDRSAALGEAVAQVIAEDRIGFGYGALAAGADIVIAEALLAAGAELHLVLPTGIDTFVAQSVTPYGAGWRARFDRCLEAATSMQSVTGVTGGYEPLATRLASDVAMGAAVLQARRLESRAAQLVVIDEGAGRYGHGAGTARDGARWAACGRTQRLIIWPREASVVASGLKDAPEGRTDRRLAAMLHIAFEGLDALDEGEFADAVDTVLAPFRARVSALAVKPDLALPAGNARFVAFADPEAAWDYARALLAEPLALPLRIAGHYALAHWLEAPPALVGRGVSELAAIAAAAMPGVLTVSETMATALHASPAQGVHAEFVGEAAGIGLFALTGRG